MFKIIFGLVFKLRDWVQNKFGQLFEKFRDPETGKVTFARPKTLKLIVGVTSLILFLLVLLSQIINNDKKYNGGMEAFEKEVKPTSGISTRDYRQNGGLEQDPFNALTAVPRDEFGKTGPLNSGVTGIVNGEELSVSQCVELIDKMKSNKKLSADESILLDRCLKENPMGLTEEEIKLANKLNDPSLTDKERELLSKVLAGTATEEERAVASNLLSEDPTKVALAKEAISQGREAIDALGKQIEGKPLTEEEKKILAKIEQNAKNPVEKATDFVKNEILKGINEKDLPKSISESVKPLDLPKDQDESIKSLAKDIADRESLINNLDNKLVTEQLQASPIAEKLAGGKRLSESETKKLQDFTKNKQQLELLKKLQEERKTEFSKRAAKFQEALAQAVVTVQQAIPTGTFVEYEGNIVDCNKAKVIHVKKKKVASKPKGTILDVDGRPLRPEEVEFIKLHRKNQYEVSKLKKDTVSGPIDINSLGQPVNLATIAGEGGQVGIQDLQSLFVFKDASLKNFELTPDMKIPAVIDSEILVSDKGKGQVIRFRILSDVHNPQTNQIIIPKGSIATAQTGGFDADTGIMDISVEKAVIGSGKTVSVKLQVGSADGSMGLRGQIRDTTGKWLAGTFITAFTAGALGWFSQQVVAPFQASTQAGQALTGAGLAGSAEVLQKVSELYSSKLQNAAVIYWVPKGIPVVLFPQ